MRVPLARLQGLCRRAVWRGLDAFRRPGDGHQPTAPRPVAGDRPFRVVFLVCESRKWTQQQVFDLLADTQGLAVSFALIPSDLAVRMNAADRARHQASQGAAFAALGPVSCDLLGAGDQLRDLRSLEADLLMLQQPWGMQDIPRRLAGRIACAHISYELGVIDDPRQQAALPDFHPWLWRMFVPGPLHAGMIRRTPGAIDPARVIASGSPRLDAWRAMLRGASRARAAARHRTVVWAPHHSLGARSLRLGTFDWSAPAMLSLARAQPDMRFVLRPHPNLWYALERFRPGTAEPFRQAWQALPNTRLCEEGDPLPALMAADALITDSASFLAEFLLSDRPILRLSRPDSTPLSEFGAQLQPGFYDCPDAATLQQHFAAVILAGLDPLHAPRRALAAALWPPGAPEAALRIRDEILAAIGR